MTRDRAQARALWLTASSVVVVVVTYLCYLEFEDWWYLRFMLPVWPMMAVAGAAQLVALRDANAQWGRAAAVVIAFAVMAHGLVFAQQHDVLTIGRTESRYPQVARLAAGALDPSAAVITVQHSGSMRYYGGRVTVRWDFLEGDELDKAVTWLAEHPALLLDASEVKDVRARFAGRSAMAALDWTPRFSFFNGETLLFDPTDRGRQITTTFLGSYVTSAVPPVPAPHW